MTTTQDHNRSHTRVWDQVFEQSRFYQLMKERKSKLLGVRLAITWLNL